METSATPGVNILIIQSTTDDKPDLFVPQDIVPENRNKLRHQVIVSENRNKLWHHMNKMFSTKLSEFYDDGNLHLHRSFIDSISACIDYSSTADGKEHSIHWTISRSTLL